MDPENVLNIFDFLWFNHEILNKNPKDHSWVKSQTHDQSEVKFSSLRSILLRSQSEDIGNSFNYGSFSPNSVLKSIPSGDLDHFKTYKQEQVEVLGMFEDQGELVASRKTPGSEAEEVTTMVVDRIEQRERKMKNKKRRCRMSKSLSDLEFEELKGFMDMGFVFSEQDKESSLVKIIPGLQRLGEREQDNEDENNEEENDDDDDDDDGDERRPYLSEAWEDWERKLEKKERKEPPPVMKWEIPVVRDEIDMKDSLKLWAHVVASFVR